MADKQIDTKKLTTEQRLELLEAQVAALTLRMNQLIGYVSMEREEMFNRRGRW